MGFTHTGTLKDVLSGGYPKNEIKNMDLCDLELFVSKLVQCTKLINSRTLGREANDKPTWWPTALDFQNFHPKNGLKTRRAKANVLIKLVIKCSKYFRKYSYNYNWFREILVNDENVFVKGHCVNDTNTEVVLKKNGKSKCNKTPKNKLIHVKLENSSTELAPDPIPVVKPSQPEYLGLFNLLPSSTKTLPVDEKQSVFIKKSLKLINSPHIPLTSDLGKLLIKRNNHHIDEDGVQRRLERTERYVNNTPSVSDDSNVFECQYTPSKRTRYVRRYKFPKRQYHQFDSAKRLLQYFKPVRVVVANNDLVKLKTEFELECRRNRKELVINLQRLPLQSTQKSST